MSKSSPNTEAQNSMTFAGTEEGWKVKQERISDNEHLLSFVLSDYFSNGMAGLTVNSYG